ncbi:hypothetical protein JHU38_11630 [Prevotella sp. A2931]|uniref:Glycoside hydrolase family 95 protein n=1 Tax=Prevotella illustrans TaxID=2800387 RepID=A0ABS3M8A1_9BACT|nr:hypothetical protein [Prevotella illustrans]
MHPPFQIDGNFGGTAGITEMLLQSHTGDIHLLPALPDAWASGRMTGIRTRANFVVDLSWNSARLTEALVQSHSGESCRLRYVDATLHFETVKGAVYKVRMLAGKQTAERLK